MSHAAPDFLDRTLSFRLSSAYDCWGIRRHLHRGVQNGIWFIDARGFDEQQPIALDHPDELSHRQQHLDVCRRSGRFSPTELATLDALIAGRTIAEIAERDGCSRQAVMARLLGNSRGQGGIVKKARALLLARTATS